MKRCSKCGEWKDESEYVKKSGKCRACRSEYYSNYYIEHHAARQATGAAYRASHRKEAIERAKAWRAKNLSRAKDNRARIYRENRESICLRVRQYRVEHREVIDNYINTHKTERAQYNAEYHRAHPEKYAKRYFVECLGITPTQELLDLKAKQIALVRAIRKQKEAKA